MKKKTKTILKTAVIAAVIAAAAGGFYVKAKKDAEPKYQSVQVQKTDIRVDHTFTGTVAAKEKQDVMSAISGVKITEVDVKEGDQVKKGDVIAKLDTSSLDEQIKEKGSTIAQTAASNAMQIKQAQAAYNHLKSNIDDGLDQSIQSAQGSVDSAYASLLSALRAYNNEVSLNNQQLSQTILSAMQGVDTAYNSLRSAALSTQQAKDAQSHARDKADDQDVEFDSFDTDQQIDTAKMNEAQAQTAYEQAVTNYKAAKINEENSLTNLYDQLISAQNSYIQAIDGYNAAVRSNDQQLENDQLSIESAKVNANDTTSQYELENLKKQKDNYVITAPISGEVTKLNAKVGNITDMTNTTSLATITDYSTMKVDIQVGEYDAATLKVGDKVKITVSALKKDYDGTVTHIDREATVSNGVSYFNAEVNFKADETVKGGMSAVVTLTVTDLKKVPSLPAEDIMTADDGTSYVYVLGSDGKTYNRRTIDTGATDGTNTQINKGVKDGETVYYDPASVASSSSDDSGYDEGDGEDAGDAE